MERKMARIIIVISLVSLMGCASTITYKGNCDGKDDTAGPCVVTASDYIVRKTIAKKTGDVTWSYTPSKWYSKSIEGLTHTLGDLIPLVGQ